MIVRMKIEIRSLQDDLLTCLMMAHALKSSKHLSRVVSSESKSVCSILVCWNGSKCSLDSSMIGVTIGKDEVRRGLVLLFTENG